MKNILQLSNPNINVSINKYSKDKYRELKDEIINEQSIKQKEYIDQNTKVLEKVLNKKEGSNN